MSQYAKAIVGAIIAGLSSIAVAMESGPVTREDILAAVIATLVAAAGVWAVPNKPAEPPEAAP